MIYDKKMQMSTLALTAMRTTHLWEDVFAALMVMIRDVKPVRIDMTR